METNRTIQRINETNWFFEKMNKIDKPLAKLTKRKRRLKFTRLEMKRGDITTDATGIQRIIRDYFEYIGISRKHKLVAIYILPKVNQEDIYNLNIYNEQ
jgi:hypothetical protein